MLQPSWVGWHVGAAPVVAVQTVPAGQPSVGCSRLQVVVSCSHVPAAVQWVPSGQALVAEQCGVSDSQWPELVQCVPSGQGVVLLQPTGVLASQVPASV